MPVSVLFFNKPEFKEDKAVPFIFVTVVVLPIEVTSPFKFAFVVTVAAFPAIGPMTLVPLMLRIFAFVTARSAIF